MRPNLKTQLLLTICTLFVFVANCSSEKEVLATFKGGEITRKELRDAYLVFGYEPNENNTSVEVQENILDTLALQRIVRDYLEKNNELDLDYIQKLVELTQGQLLINYYKNDYLKKALKKNTIDMITFQLAILRSPNSIEPDSDLEKKAQELLTQLNSTKDEAKIREIISSHTFDINTKPTGGITQPSCYNCGQDEFYSIFQEAIQAKDKKFYLTSANTNLYLYKVLNLDKLHSKVLARYIEEKIINQQDLAREYLNTTNDELGKQAAQSILNQNPKVQAGQYAELFLRQFNDKLWKEELTRIKSSSQIQVHEISNFEDPKDINPKNFSQDIVLVQLPNGEKITFFQLQTIFKEVNNKIYKNEPQDPKKEIFDILNFFYKFYIPALYLEWEPNAQKIKESDRYKLALEYLKNQYIFNGFVQSELNEKIIIPEEDIRNTYEAGKMFAYSKEDPKDKNKRIPLPYSEVRDKIRSELENQRKRNQIESKISLLKMEYDLNIKKELLKPGKI